MARNRDGRLPDRRMRFILRASPSRDVDGAQDQFRLHVSHLRRFVALRMPFACGCRLRQVQRQPSRTTPNSTTATVGTCLAQRHSEGDPDALEAHDPDSGRRCRRRARKAASDTATAATIAGYFSVLADIFLRIIKMIIAPLVFATVVAGIAGTGDAKTVGRIGLKALAWFISASLVSLLLGTLFANALQPGANLKLPLPDAGLATNLKTGSLSVKEFIVHVFPRSFFESMAGNEILQILVFSLFFGFALTALKGRPATTIIKFIDELAHAMLKLTEYVMYFAPVGVFGAIATSA
jgi:Sodium:dicarboxylate symporter family